ncbi:DUF6255 family natural product biosynthesis protein [Streptomyces eurocidicus]|uniref:DUF6255 family natural product biosynthesis protein n=1 Tax=Streptomyces eurocidicus TaxID=66423 RepID=UPI001C88AE6D
MRRRCEHRGRWTHRGGESRCEECGTVRFTDYGPLRLPEPPEAVRPDPARARRADRAAATYVARMPRRREWWSLATPVVAQVL